MSTSTVDVDRALQAQYLAAVARELEARRLPVDAAVLADPGGTVVLADPDGPTCVRWDGGRTWTLPSLAGTRGGVRRLRMHRLPAPPEVAQFVARAAAGERTRARRALPWHPASGWRAAPGH